MKKYFILLLTVLTVFSGFPMYANADSDTGTYAVPNTTEVATNKVVSISLPQDRTNVQITGVQYNGQAIADYTLNGSKLNVTLSGTPVQVTGTAKGYQTEGKKDFQSNPGNIMFRYADGVNWQINYFDYNTGVGDYRKEPGHIPSGSSTSDRPADNAYSTAKKTFGNPVAIPAGTVWFDENDNVLPSSAIQTDTVTFDKLPTTDKPDYVLPSQPLKLLSSSDNTYVVGYYINDAYGGPPGNEVQPGAGNSDLVIGYRYWPTLLYTIQAQYSTTQYSYGGTITYSYTYDPAAPEPTPTPTPPPVAITGDFDILPSATINYRDSFTLQPKNFNISSGCTYQSHQFQIERNGSISSSSPLTSPSASKTYTYATYPYNIGVGTHTVSINISTTCGDSGWIASKSLIVNGPADNNPPDFQIGWTTPGQWNQYSVQTEVVAGTQLDLVYLDDPAPSDPDGDSIEWLGFDFSQSNSWAQQIPANYSEYGNGYHRVVMDQPGYYTVKGIMRDQFGATTTRTASITVIPPNPVPVISLPSTIRENHPVSPAINGDASYSPVSGRTIDHTRDIWTNKLSVYPTPGPQTVTLEVFDNTGLKSLEPASKTFTVLPDEPPIAQLDVPPLGIRGQTYDFFNKSTSPDGDQIVSASYRYKYDANNNGFADDSWISLSGTMTKASLTPAKVGKYMIELTVTENYGKSATTSGVLDVLNQAPAVSFLVEGQNTQPNPDQTTSYSADTIMNNWPLYYTNTTTAITSIKAGWQVANGALAAGLGRKLERPEVLYSSYTRSGTSYHRSWAPPFQDGGYGPNTLNSYRAIQTVDTAKTQPILAPDSYGNWVPVSFDKKSVFIKSNQSHIYFVETNNYNSSRPLRGSPFYALNKSKIGRYQAKWVCDGCYYASYVHEYLDGSPYDLILNPKQNTSIPTMTVGNFNNYTDYYTFDISKAYSTSTASPYEGDIVGYEVSDRTIYQLIRWYCKSCAYVGRNKTNWFQYELRSYDAFTGQLINAATADILKYFKGDTWMELYTNGDNLVVMEDSKNMVVELDRYGNIVKQGSIGIRPWYTDPYGYTCTPQAEKKYQGPDGEWYIYETAGCYDSDSSKPGDTYVYRLNTDYTVAWRVKLQGRDPNFRYTFVAAMGDPSDAQDILVINPKQRQVLARSYKPNGYGYDYYVQSIDMDTGAWTSFNTTTYSYSSETTNFIIDWNGNYVLESPFTVRTPDGYRTKISSNTVQVLNSFGSAVSSFTGGGIISVSGPYATATKDLKYGRYVGDGLYMGMYNYTYCCSGTGDNFYPWLMMGTPTSNAEPYHPLALGQFVSTETSTDEEFNFTMSMSQANADSELAGFSFRMMDPKNRYAVETNGSQLYLSKYVNGTRTVLASQAYPFQDSTNYNFKIKAAGNRIQVDLNGVPYFDKTDNTYTSGKFGPFTDKSYVDFSNISRKQISTPDVQWLTSYAIWDQGTATAAVRYSNMTFTDPENDPKAGNYQWTIQHTPKFLNNQGLSAMNGQTYSSPALTFDKVGNYTVTMKAQDDPNGTYPYPNNTFNNYRQWSNSYWQIITVHRRPVAQFTLSTAADGTVLWSDSSYDPDRYDPATGQYSTEATGINYQTTRGILERKYYYVTPSGTTVNQKLVTPTETGTYRVGMQAKDEYSGWSYWNEQQIVISQTVAPDTPPVAGFNVSPTTTYRGVTVTITSTAHDAEDGVAANLQHEYYIRNVTTGSAESLAGTNRGTWTKAFSSLGVFEIRQVVTDSKGLSSQIIKQVTILNRAPSAQFSWTPNPVLEGDRLTLLNQSTDPDEDVMSFEWEITAPDSTRTLYHTGDVVLSAVQPGTYQIKLTAADGGASSSVIRDIHAAELTIQAAVKHTPEWLRHHEEKGHQVDQPPLDFYSGEIFVVEAESSPASVLSVTAWLDTEGLDGQPLQVDTELVPAAGSQIQYDGELYDERLISFTEGLPNGRLPIHFCIEYANGVIKEDTIDVNIIGNAQRAVGVHRRQ